ncbi:MAG: CAP domain-containing protein [Ruminococcus sp.]|nr:CAP domain-containing protein [Ruminococcus sp.]
MKKFLSLSLALMLILGLNSFGITASAAEKTIMPYNYLLLTEDEQGLYDSLREAIITNTPELVFEPALPRTAALKLLTLARDCDPELMNIKGINVTGDRNLTTFTFTYSLGEAAYKLAMKRINDAAAEVVEYMDDRGYSDYQKINYIHNYIAKNAELSTDYKYRDIPYGVLYGGKGSEKGYAKAFSFLCAKAEIYSTVVYNAENASDVWNKVYYNQKWYNVDVAADDADKTLINNVNYAFLMVPDFFMTAAPDSSVFISPECTDAAKGYYQTAKLMASTAEKAGDIIKAQVLKNAKTKKVSNNTFSISISRNESYAEFKDLVNNEFYLLDLLIAADKSLGGGKIVTDVAGITFLDRTRVAVITVYYPNTKLSDYYKNTDSFSDEMIDYINSKIGGETPAETLTPETESAEEDTAEDFSDEMLKLVNELRVSKNLNELTIDEGLTKAANLRAKELPENFSHTRPDGTECFTAFESFGSYGYMGENIAMGTLTMTTAAEAYITWENSEGHYANMVNENFTLLGVGKYTDGDSTYWVQVFAS